MPEKDRRFEIRLSTKDADYLDKIAKKGGMKKSEIVRRLIHGKNIKIIDNLDVETIRNIRTQIIRIGNYQVMVHNDLLAAKKNQKEIEYKIAEIDAALKEETAQKYLKEEIGKLTIEIAKILEKLE